MGRKKILESVNTDQSIRMIVPSNPKHLSVVRVAVECMAGKGNFAKAVAHQIGLAVSEALANVIEHGYDGAHDQQIEIIMGMVVCEDRKGLAITIHDAGRQVDPSVICGRKLEEVRPGGLGVHIIKTVMDEVHYSCPTKGGMCLEMIKYKS